MLQLSVKVHIRENSVSQVINQNALLQSDCRILLPSISRKGISQYRRVKCRGIHQGKVVIHQGKVACESTTLGSVWLGMPSHVQTCSDKPVLHLVDMGKMIRLKIILKERLINF